MIAHAAHEGASKASKPCCTSTCQLASLEAEFFRLWSIFPTVDPSELSELHVGLNDVLIRIQAAPIASADDAVRKMRTCLLHAGWTPDQFANYDAVHSQKVAADTLDQVVAYLQSLGDGG